MGKSSQYFALAISACLLVNVYAEGLPNGSPNTHSKNDQKAVSNVRVKRWGWLIPVVIVACLIWCKKGRGNPPEDRDDPEFTYCPKDITKIVPKGQSSVVVSWTTPTATDKTSEISRIDQEQGKKSGSSFYNTGLIKYVAHDASSNSAECKFTVHIKLNTCLKPTYLQNGYVRCPTTYSWASRVIWGRSCDWSCREGYELRDKSTATQECGSNTHFSEGGTAECKVKTCEKAKLGTNMYLEDCSHGDKYGSVCFIECVDGYGPQDKTRKLTCGSDKKWAGDLYPCTDLPDKVPPYFEFCPHDIEITVPKGETSVKVTWTDPIAKDSDSGIKSIKQIYGPPKYSMINETTQITFQARDKETNSATCSFQVNVKSITCQRPFTPINGKLICPTRGWIIWGDVCTWSCDEGAKMSGTAKQTCTERGQFSDWGDVSCTLITCPRPVKPNNGNVNCQTLSSGSVKWGDGCTWSCDTGFDIHGTPKQTCMESGQFSTGGSVTCTKKECPDINGILKSHMILDSCTNGNYFESQCIFKCEDGYGPLQSTRAVTCTAMQNWKGTIKECKDIDPPKIDNCPSNIIEVYTEKGEEYGFGTWLEPTATDLQGSVELKQTKGWSSGSRFPTKPTNLHRIIYSALDEAGNEAEQCVFTVQVIDRTCEPYTDSEKMTVSCDGFTWGSACNLTCDPGYPLNGSSIVYCEEMDDKSLDWEVDPYKPFCTILPCPDLKPPVNGALACSNWAHGRYCKMSCNSEYTFPRFDHSREWTCDTTEGLWNPRNTQPPDCNRRRPPGSMDQSTELWYFTGDCTDETTQSQILESFMTRLNESRYKSTCTLSDECVVDNVDVTCGPNSRTKKSIRNKRSIFTHIVRIGFRFKMKIRYPENFSYDDADALLIAMEDKFFEMSDIFQQDVLSGVMDLDIPGLATEVDADSYTYGWSEFQCDYGLTPDYASFSCAMCPEGTMYNGDTDNCIDCPVGSYQDEPGQLQCKQCPEQTSTVTTGSSHIDQCKQICDVGHYSLTGLANCATCHIGSYQDEIGSTNCKMCPSDTNTLSPGSFDVSLCFNNDEIKTWNLCNRSACNGGICLFNSDGTTHCVCYDGFTGDMCEIPPDPCEDIVCENGGSCVPNGSNYTCRCPLGYTGHFCEELAQNGNFTEWTIWSECSATCGSGTISRVRTCDNPAPGPNGLPCLGETHEIEICQQEECPGCEQLEFPDSYRHECNITKEGEHVCNIGCKDGYSNVQNRFRKIRCGPQTEYVWSFRVGNPNRNLPACARSLLPTTLSVKSKLVNSSIPCDADVSLNGIQSFIGEKSNCSKMENCRTNVFTECIGADTTRRIRSVRSLATVIEIAGTLPSIDYFPNGVYNSDIATRAAQSWTTLASDMTSLVESLSDATTSGELVVVADGIEYGVTHEYIPDQKCAQGKVPQEGLCVTCPVGMYSTAQQCELCALGYYQDREGQASCKQCPHGYTTLAEGAVKASQCNESGDISITTSMTPSAENSKSKEYNEDNGISQDNNDKLHSDDNDNQSDNEDHTGKNDNQVDIMTTLPPDIEKVNIKQTQGYMFPTVGGVIGLLFIVIVIVSVTIVCKKKQKPRKDISTKYGAAIEPEDQGDITEKANGCTPATTALPDRYLKYPVCTNPALCEDKGETNFKTGDSLDNQEKKCTIADNNDEIIIAKNGLKEVVPYSDRPLTATSVVMNSRPATAGSIALGLGSRQGSVASLGGLTDACNPCPKIE